MKYTFIQEFKGEIEGVTFTDQNLFDVTVYVMETLELEAEKQLVDSARVEVFSKELWNLYLDSDFFELADIEKEIGNLTDEFPIGGAQ